MAFAEGVQARRARDLSNLEANQQRLTQFTASADQLNAALDQLIEAAVKARESGAESVGDLFRGSFGETASVLANTRRNFIGGNEASMEAEVRRQLQRFDSFVAGTLTPGQRAQIEAQAKVSGASASAQALSEAGVETTTAQTARAAGLLPDQAGVDFQSPVGKLLSDRQLATDTFGADSVQVRVLDAAIDADQNPDPSISDNTSLFRAYASQSKDFVTGASGFLKVVNASEGGTGQDDVALIFGFFKTIDPTSTIREGEFATAQNTGGVEDRIIAQYNRLLEGERLSERQRQGFVGAASRQFLALAEQQQFLQGSFRNLATGLNFDPDIVIQDLVDPTLIERAREQASLAVDPISTPALTEQDQVILNKSLEQISVEEVKRLSPAAAAVLDQRIEEAKRGQP